MKDNTSGKKPKSYQKQYKLGQLDDGKSGASSFKLPKWDDGKSGASAYGVENWSGDTPGDQEDAGAGG
jgi:hypothetical protein